MVVVPVNSWMLALFSEILSCKSGSRSRDSPAPWLAALIIFRVSWFNAFEDAFSCLFDVALKVNDCVKVEVVVSVVVAVEDKVIVSVFVLLIVRVGVEVIVAVVLSDIDVVDVCVADVVDCVAVMLVDVLELLVDVLELLVVVLEVLLKVLVLLVLPVLVMVSELVAVDEIVNELVVPVVLVVVGIFKIEIASAVIEAA